MVALRPTRIKKPWEPVGESPAHPLLVRSALLSGHQTEDFFFVKHRFHPLRALVSQSGSGRVEPDEKKPHATHSATLAEMGVLDNDGGDHV